MAAAAGLLLVLAPEQTRSAIASIFRGAEAARQSVPDAKEVAAAAIAYCRKNPEPCTKAVEAGLAAERKAGLKP